LWRASGFSSGIAELDELKVASFRAHLCHARGIAAVTGTQWPAIEPDADDRADQ
jgi:hypothetical protein